MRAEIAYREKWQSHDYSREIKSILLMYCSLTARIQAPCMHNDYLSFSIVVDLILELRIMLCSFSNRHEDMPVPIFSLLRLV